MADSTLRSTGSIPIAFWNGLFDEFETTGKLGRSLAASTRQKKWTHDRVRFGLAAIEMRLFALVS
jgi:hypothetical protein